MSTAMENNRGPLADQTVGAQTDATAGPTEAFETPVEIRNLDGAVDEALHAWVLERLGRQLGKHATQIERLEVRFGDENGDKGGISRKCMIHLVLSALPPVVVETAAGEDREAFDLAAGRVNRALQRAMEKHGFSTKHKRRQRGEHGEADAEQMMDEAATLDIGALDPQPASELSMYDKRVGRREQQLQALQANAHAPSVSEGHTAKRNAKLNTRGMAYALEDSTDGKPSRKSTRASANHIKHATGLTVRAKSAVHSPERRAARGR
jgi:hypothetical protein